MKTAHRQQSDAKRRRRWVADPRSFQRVINRLEPFTADELLHLELPIRMSFQALRSGKGTEQDWHDIAAAINVTIVRSESIDPLCEQTAIAALRKVAAGDEAARQIHDVMADHRLVDYTTRAMAEKLAVARARGRGGWWDATECSIDFLRGLLQEHIIKGDMRDVMNIAAMIYTREIADAPWPEICPNCDTALPDGCQGTFRDDGAHCRWNLQANASLSGRAEAANAAGERSA